MALLSPFSRWFNRSAEQALQSQAHQIYLRLVAQSRQPVFYATLGVPDTPDGRFDIIALHLFLFLQRLQQEPERAPLGRALTEVFFADMDRSLREMGVGDMGVGRRVKRMADAFYGRVQAYEAADSHEAMVEALRRNAYAEGAPRHEQVGLLAGYALRSRAALQAASADALSRGDMAWPGIDTGSSGVSLTTAG